MNISVLAIGSEILDGRVLDTNSQFISTHLTDRGLKLQRTVVCDDNEKEILESLAFLCNDSQVIIVTGGLGPTTDDLTREAIATFTRLPLVHHADALDRLKKRFEERKRVFDPLNEKQAYFPEKSLVIPNPVGTAEGFIVSHGTVIIISVPGVPKEMQPMFLEHILPRIQSAATLKETIFRRRFRVFGLPEATVGRKIQALSLPDSITVSYRAAFPEVHIVLKGAKESELSLAWEQSIEAVGKDFIFSQDTEHSLVDAVLGILRQNGATIATAESCTGGMLGMLLTAISGASDVVAGGIISYSNALKISLLGVAPKTIEQFGAVSAETAAEMAKGCSDKTGATYAVSITGVAGPQGGSIEKPVGTFYVGLSAPEGTTAYQHFFPSDRASVRKYASYVALDMVRRAVLKLPQRNYAEQTIHHPTKSRCE